MHYFSMSAGAVCFRNDDALLVKIGYGLNSDMWMIPGGVVERGESIEEAVIREVREETGLETEIVRMVGLRSGTQERKEGIQTSLYLVFEVLYKSGIIKKDEHEIVDIKYWNVREIMESDEIVEISKEIIQTAWRTKNGLYQGNQINTKNIYRSYHYYLPNI